ncbi:protein translocase subunit SecF [Chloroflexota bacterium]
MERQMVNFVNRRLLYLAISAIVLFVFIISLAVAGIRPGIEFSSGSTMTLVFTETVEQSDLRNTLSELGYDSATIQGSNREGYTVTTEPLSDEETLNFSQALKNEFGPTAVFMYSTDKGDATVSTIVFSYKVSQDDLEAVLSGQGFEDAEISDTNAQAFLVRTSTIGQEPGTDEEGNPVPSDMERLQQGLESKHGDFALFDFYSVSPTIATDIVQKAIIAVVIASVAILLYVTWAFRRMPSPIRWGTCAIIALVHDTVVVLGIFSILGWTLKIEVDAMFITGVLTVVGYSVHDTIVVFDRIRENVLRGISRDFATTINCSLNETLGRSLNTSATTLFVLLALYLMGGVTIRNFVLVMIIGVAIGTYSSIFVASQFLVVWEKKEWKRFIDWIPFFRSSS